MCKKQFYFYNKPLSVHKMKCFIKNLTLSFLLHKSSLPYSLATTFCVIRNLYTRPLLSWQTELKEIFSFFHFTFVSTLPFTIFFTIIRCLRGTLACLVKRLFNLLYWFLKEKNVNFMQKSLHRNQHSVTRPVLKRNLWVHILLLSDCALWLHKCSLLSCSRSLTLTLKFSWSMTTFV